MKTKEYLRRIRLRLKKHSLTAHVLGWWLSRKFNRHGILVVSGGRPLPRIINKGGKLTAENCQFYSRVRIEMGPLASVHIGNGTYLNRNTLIIAEKQITIGRNCRISWDVIIMDTDQHALTPDAVYIKPVIIEDNVWIGCRSIILKGVTVGKGAVIAAGSVVTKNVAPYTIVGGSPAQYLANVPGSHIHNQENETWHP